MSRSWDFKTLSRNSNALSCTAYTLGLQTQVGGVQIKVGIQQAE